MANLAQVIYGYSSIKISRRQAERFVLAHAASVGLQVPHPPIARFWCRPAPAGSPAAWIVGFTAPALPMAPAIEVAN